MKQNVSLFAIVFVTLATIFSCKQDAPETTISTLKGKDTLSIDTYNTWKQGWLDKGISYSTDSSLTKYFTMPLIDLQEFANDDHVAARFVMGLDTTKAKWETHIMLVGVDSTGSTMLPSPTNGAKIYDVTRPCPHFCDNLSIGKGE